MILSKNINKQVNGRMMYIKVKVNKDFKMVHIMKVIFLMALSQETDIIYVILAYIKDNLKMEILMERELLHMLIRENTSEIGKMD